MFCLNNKIHFSLANANNSASFKRKMVLNHRFCSFTTTNKLVNEAANDSARVSGQDRKKLPALGTNQIAGFGGFHPLASLEKNNNKLGYPMQNTGSRTTVFGFCLSHVYRNFPLLYLCSNKIVDRYSLLHLCNFSIYHDETAQGNKKKAVSPLRIQEFQISSGWLV